MWESFKKKLLPGPVCVCKFELFLFSPELFPPLCHTHVGTGAHFRKFSNLGFFKTFDDLSCSLYEH